jgi:hypothetical protein
MSFLFGSAPKVTTTTQPTINADQTSALSSVLNLLTGGGTPAGVRAYGGQFGAGLSPLQQTSLAGLENQAGQPTPVFDPNAAFAALSKSLNFSGPGAVSAPNVGTSSVTAPNVTASNVTASTVNPTHIDATNAFRTGVVEPLTNDFLSRTLPGIAGKYGASAGGAFSSDALHARQGAALDLEEVLAEQGSKFALGAAQANQSVDTTTALANQSAYTTTELANQEAALRAAIATATGGLTAQTANQEAGLRASTANAGNALTAGTVNAQSQISTQDAILRALGITPSVASTGITESGGIIDNLLRTLSGGAVPQATQQTELTGQYQDFLNQINQENTRRANLIALGTGRTQETQSVASGGSTGVVPGLLQGLGTTNAAGGSGIASLLALLSDRRAKTDVELVGEVDGFPLYRYIYKDDPDKVVNIGLMAQDVEKRKPHAVGRTPEGLKTVNYAAALEDVLKRAA